MGPASDALDIEISNNSLFFSVKNFIKQQAGYHERFCFLLTTGRSSVIHHYYLQTRVRPIEQRQIEYSTANFNRNDLKFFKK